LRSKSEVWKLHFLRHDYPSWLWLSKTTFLVLSLGSLIARLTVGMKKPEIPPSNPPFLFFHAIKSASHINKAEFALLMLFYQVYPASRGAVDIFSMALCYEASFRSHCQVPIL
jgi:hypothetical protein